MLTKQKTVKLQKLKLNGFMGVLCTKICFECWLILVFGLHNTVVREAGVEPARPEWTLEPESETSHFIWCQTVLPCIRFFSVFLQILLFSLVFSQI